MPKIRTIIVERDAQRSIDQIYGGTELADAALNGVTFVIARDPEMGEQLSPHVWAVETDARGIWKRVEILYAFSDDEVLILSVREL